MKGKVITLDSRSKLKLFFEIAGLAAVYFLAAKWGLTLAFLQANATAVWPPTGIALASLLIGGWRLWPGIFLGAFLANFLTAGTVFTSLAIAGGNSLEALMGCYLVNRWAQGREGIRKSSELYRFAFLGGLVAPMVSATIGVGTLVLGGFAQAVQFKDVWLTWWLGDMGGALLVAPPLLLWPGPRVRRIKPRRMGEGAALLGAFLLVAWVLFGGWSVVSSQHYPAQFIFIPLLLWSAVSFDPFVASLAVLAVSIVSVEGTLRGWGPFHGNSENQSLLFLQSFMSVTSLAFLALAAVVEERKKAEEGLRWSHSDLQVKVLERTEELTMTNLRLEMEMKEREAVARQLMVSNERFRLLSEASQEGVVLVENGVIREANSSFCRIFGYEGSEVSGMRPEDFVIPECKREVTAYILAHYEKVYKAKGLRKDGTQIDLEINGKTLPRAGGEARVTAIRDVTESNRREEENRRLALIVENSLDMILLSMPGGETLFFNRAGRRMLGIGEEADLKALNPGDYLFPGDLERAEKTIAPILMRDGRWEGEFRFRNPKTGNPVYLHFTSVLMKDEETGKPTLSASIGRDITERKKIEELARSNRELEQFAYVASHDLQEPLRMVASFAQLLARNYKGKLEPEADEYIHHMVDGVQRMQALIGDLLAYSRLENATQPFGGVDSAEALRQALLNLEATLKESGAQVAFGGLPVVLGDFNQIVQLFQNLIGNAVKFRGSQLPKIRVEAEPRDGEWVFSVRDNGIGIDEKYSNQIFEIFKRLHTRSEYPGTGIGLAICKKVVTRHGGRIWVESKPGEGACFYWTMPPLKGGGI